MQQRPTSPQEERASGTAVAVFSVFITLVALFVCFVVVMLTAKLPNSGNDGEAATSPVVTQPPAESDDVPVFAPSGTVMLPQANASTALLDGEIYSPYAALVDAESGAILAGKNADVRFDPASMTKIMTLLVAVQRLNTDDLAVRVPFTSEIRDFVQTGNYNGASCYWWEDKYLGDMTSIQDLLYGIGVLSAADCSMMVVSYLVGKTPAESEAQFVAWMNEEVAAMGLQNTHFDNVIGYESEQNYSTASDMAAILMRALECPLISEILTCPTYRFYSYYQKNGAEASYGNTFFSTLFYSNENNPGRMGNYKKETGTEFALATLSFRGGKTGSLQFSKVWHYSLASFATDAEGKLYVLVTGNATGSTGRQGGANLMRDAKAIYDTYAK